MNDGIFVFIELDDEYRALPREFGNMEHATIAAEIIGSISGCDTIVGVRLPVESEGETVDSEVGE